MLELRTSERLREVRHVFMHERYGILEPPPFAIRLRRSYKCRKQVSLVILFSRLRWPEWRCLSSANKLERKLVSVFDLCS
jgi:hypothetical protein